MQKNPKIISKKSMPRVHQLAMSEIAVNFRPLGKRPAHKKNLQHDTFNNRNNKNIILNPAFCPQTESTSEC
jgi:hypothetical protein